MSDEIKLPPLPKPVFPSYEDVLPYSGKKFKYRAFNVREQRSILTAQESKDKQDMIQAILDTVESATGLDSKNLALIDLEYVMLKIRAHSIDNEIRWSFLDPDTEEVVNVKFKIDDFHTELPEGFSNDILIGDNTTLTLRLPTMSDVQRASKVNGKGPEQLATLISSCIVRIIEGDTVYDLTQYPDQAKLDYMDSLSDSALEKIKDYFEKAPRITREIPYKLSTGEQRTLKISGLEYFFK